MNESDRDPYEARLVALFEQSPEPVNGAEFAAAVMARIRRSSHVRRIVLAVAVACGAAISYGSMVDLTTLVGAALTDYAAHWRTLPWTALVTSAAFNLTWPFVLLATLRTLLR